MRPLIIGAAMLLAVGCADYHDDDVAGPSHHAPSIANLTVTPLTPLVEGTRAVYELEVDFVDPDGDLAGGSCEVDTSIGFAEVPVTVTRTDAHATSGVATCRVEVTVRGRIVSGFLTIVDQHGHASNALGFTLAARTTS